MNWFTPPVAWATRPCLCATCPSCCRPCWISCLIKVSSQNTVRRKLEIEQNKLMFHCSIENLCGAFQLHALPLKKKKKKKKSRRSQPVPWWLQRYTTSFNSMWYTKPAFSWRKCNIVLWPEILRQQPGDEAVQARLFTGHTKEASVIPGWLLWELMVGGRIREMRWEQDEADSQYKILNVSKGTSAALPRVLLGQAFLETALLEKKMSVYSFTHIKGQKSRVM